MSPITQSVEDKIKALNLELPELSTPVANYVPFTVIDSLVYISGQLCLRNGSLQYTGKLGRDHDVSAGQEAARLCGLNLLSQLKAACNGDLDRVKQCVRLGIFVHSTDDFTQQAQVANGVSDLMVAVFGERGKHARASVGVNTLPLNAAVEVEGLFQIEQQG